MAESRARTLANLANTNALSVDGSSLDVGISSTSPDSDLNVGASIKMDGPSGIITATSFVGNVTGAVTGSGANLTSLPAGQLTGSLPAIDGSALTGVANTDFVVSTATTTARLVVTNGVNVSGVTTTAGLNNTITGGNVIALMDSTNNSQNHRVRINSQGTSSSTSLAISNSNANNQSSIVHGNDGGLTIRSDQTAGAEPTTGTAKITIDGTSGNVSIGATLQIGIGKSINFGSTQKAFVQGHSVGVGTTTTTGRNAGLGTAQGTLIFNSTTKFLELYTGTAWVKVSGQVISNATGGSKDTSSRSGYAVHTFTGSGSFQVIDGSGDVEYVIYGGGAGGGGHAGGGGGGAGGVMSGTIPNLQPGTYTVTVGPGGGGGPTSQPATGTDGGNSSIAVPSPKGGTIIAYGGGAGGDASNGENGGSGGGGPGTGPAKTGGYGFNPTTPAPNLNPALAPLHPYPITQGGNGASRQAAPDNLGGGGGGTGGGSHPTNAIDAVSANGGPGTTFTITGASVTKGGGGGAGAHAPGESGGEGGSGGGADGQPQGPNSQAPSASANTASGGGGAGGTQGVNPASGGDGGSGIVYIAYEV